MMKIYMLSGGIDSTGLLYKLLKESEEFIHVHHIRIVNCEVRDEAEDRAVKKIVEDCRTIRDFGFSSSEIHIPDFNIGFAGLDLLSVAHIGAIVTRGVQAQFIHSQNTLYDAECVIAGTKDELESVEHWNSVKRKIGADMIFEGNFYQYYEDGIKLPVISYPAIDITKRELAEYIPEHILKYVNSCRNPSKIGDEYVECGMCHGCIHKQDATRGLNA